MKALITAAIAASVFVAFAAPPNAYAHRHKRYMKRVQPHAHLPRYAAYGYVPRRQIEYDTRALPFGTSTWWQQYERERGGRGGR
jgi:hypothetical protein